MRLRTLLSLTVLVVLVAVFGLAKGIGLFILWVLLPPLVLLAIVVVMVFWLRRRLKRQMRDMAAEFTAHVGRAQEAQRRAQGRQDGTVIDATPVRIKDDKPSS
jgi:uncharacterized membrane protein